MSGAKQFVIATAGHVDHGKSALVKALTGTDPDRLPEEKARQITIDLGFAELSVHAPNGEPIHAAMVDVPGHEDFVRNMIAGVGSIDLALFVVAADDGWMPQTEEHLQILDYLGVRRSVIALTKSDIGDVAKVSREIREQLNGSRFSEAPLVPVSARAGTGLDELLKVIGTELAKTEPQRDTGKPRLFVDRAFTLHGIGTVVTGTLTGGIFHRGDTVVVQPRELSTRVRSLQSHGRDVDVAVPGMRTALNLPELELDREINRGDTITATGFKTSSVLGVALTKSSRAAKHPLKNRARVYLHHGTSRISARVRLFDKDALRQGESSIAQVTLESPVLAILGDKFVLRDPSEQFTIAGGIVLDPHGNFSAELLRERAVDPNDVDLCVRTELKCNRAVAASALLHQSHFSADEILAAAERANVLRRGGLAVDLHHWNSLRARAIELIDQMHRKFPDKPGLELSELRTALGSESPELIGALIDDLSAIEFVREKSAIARKEHHPALPPALQAIAQRILEQLSTKPFDPPARKQVAADSTSQQTIRFLIESGAVIDLGPDVIVTAESFSRMKDVIVRFISKNGAATVSELRQKLQTSRRIMVPFLERLDRDGVTRRLGDKRKLADEIGSRALK